jgi:hypothetical protein
VAVFCIPSIAALLIKDIKVHCLFLCPGVIRLPKLKLSSEQKAENILSLCHMRQRTVARWFLLLCYD